MPSCAQRNSADEGDVEKAVAAAPDPAAAEALVSLMEEISDQPLYRNNSIQLLVDGPATHGAMLEAIAAAENHIHFETYIFADDEIGAKFARAFTAKAQDGVAVRIIYDSVGSRDSRDKFFARMEQAGVEVVEFNPIEPGRGAAGEEVDTRDHRKLMVVDGAVAFTGGLNVDRSYAQSSKAVSGRAGGAGWRDTHVAIRGPAVEGFQRLFVGLWNSLDVKPIVARDLPGPPENEGDALVRVLSAVGGNDSMSAIRVAYAAAIGAAVATIDITQSYFAPDEAFVRALQEAAARGVGVRILVAGISDSKLLLNASRAHYADLLDAGVRVYESQEAILHAKTAVIDGVWSTVGSSNLDSLSFIHNHEVNAAIVDLEFGAQMEDLFELDLAHSREIEREAWARRSMWQRAKELWSTLLNSRL